MSNQSFSNRLSRGNVRIPFQNHRQAFSWHVSWNVLWLHLSSPKSSRSVLSTTSRISQISPQATLCLLPYLLAKSWTWSIEAQPYFWVSSLLVNTQVNHICLSFSLIVLQHYRDYPKRRSKEPDVDLLPSVPQNVIKLVNVCSLLWFQIRQEQECTFYDCHPFAPPPAGN